MYLFFFSNKIFKFDFVLEYRDIKLAFLLNKNKKNIPVS